MIEIEDEIDIFLDTENYMFNNRDLKFMWKTKDLAASVIIILWKLCLPVALIPKLVF